MITNTVKFLSLSVVSFSLVCCSPAALNLADKLASAASLLCESLYDYEKYEPQLKAIDELVKNKDYMAALFSAKALYAQAESNGDVEMLQEMQPLITTLVNLVKSAPSKLESQTTKLEAM